jgi:hypothetical protein
MIKIPKNIIIESKYTQGNEYMYTNTQDPYQGYYYELNGKIFAGKEFNVYASELQKITPSNINTFLTKASTYVYGVISNIKLNDTIPASIIAGNSGKIGGLRYFYKKTNIIPMIIRETNEETYKNLNNNPLYQFATVLYDEFNLPDPNSLDNAEKQLSGIKDFISSIPFPPNYD